MPGPRPANFDYQTYLASREWALLKRQVKARSKGKCERCRYGDHEQTHHLTYARIGHEWLEDLQGVCRECHEFLSGVSDRDPAAEMVPFDPVRFARYEHRGEREWYAYIEPVGGQAEPFELRVREDGDGLFAIFVAMSRPEKVWHPFLLSGVVLDAFLSNPPGEEGRPPFIEQLGTCFFPCDDGDCEVCGT